MTIKCKNMTHAIKAQKILVKNGIEASVKKTTYISGQSGCVYTINFNEEFCDKAMSLMMDNGVIIHKSEKERYRCDDL